MAQNVPNSREWLMFITYSVGNLKELEKVSTILSTNLNFNFFLILISKFNRISADYFKIWCNKKCFEATK